MKKIIAILGILLLISIASGLLGDVNNDCKTDLVDLALMGKAWHTRYGNELWNKEADLDGSGAVNLKDLYILRDNYNKGC